MNSFNQELVIRTIKYFKEKYNHEISSETAEEYLRSLADLYKVVTKFAKPK